MGVMCVAGRWLGHADARQVYDLPKYANKETAVYDRLAWVKDPDEKNSIVGKSETCRASEWQSHCLQF
jgi:hypothetical protein